MVLLKTCFFLMACFAKPGAQLLQSVDSPAIRSYVVNFSTPVFDHQGKLLPYASFFMVYRFGKRLLYQYFYHFDSTVDGRHLLSEERPAFFAVDKDSAYGYHFDPRHRLPDDRRMKRDSISKKFSLETHDWDNYASRRPDSTSTNPADGTRVEKFEHHPEQGDAFSYTIFFTFDPRLLDAPVSFSKSLDHARKMKLVRIEAFYRAAYDPVSGITIPERHAFFELKEVFDTEPALIMPYFVRLMAHEKVRAGY